MSHSKPSTTVFQPHYLVEFPWVKEHPTIKTVASCTLCHKDINIIGMGKTALKSHAKSAKHIMNENNRLKCLPLKMFFNAKTAENSLPGSSDATSDARDSASSSSSPQQKTVNPNQPNQSTEEPVIKARPQKSCIKQHLFNESVTKTEILWCLRAVMNHMPFAVAARCAKSFGVLFPDSEIASKIRLDYTKIGYVIVFGLAPYFARQLDKNMTASSSKITLCFDESLNKVSQRQQMDLHIRWWDDSENKIKTRYYTSVFLGHSTAKDLLDAIKSEISPETMKKIIQISMDGPNVNKKLFKDLQEELSESPDNHKLLNIGSCGLHTLHNAFKCGMVATKWDMVGFLRGLYNLFKDSPARRADYTRITSSASFPLKFCAIRWVESGKVAERAISILPGVKKYVEEQKNNEPSCNSFTVVKHHVNDKLLPAKLAFFSSMCGIFEPFLTEFQSDAPMAPLIFNEINSLLWTLIDKVIKRDHLESVNHKIDKIDFSLCNLIYYKHFDLGFATKDALKSCATATDQEKGELLKSARNAVVAMSKKIIDKSPVKFNLSRAITCLDPKVIAANKGQVHLNKCLEILVENKIVSGIFADSVKQQYVKLFSLGHVLEMCKTYRRDKRLDTFYLEIIETEGAEEFSKLLTFIKLILTLSHGNAAVERGFSINKECIVDNLKEESLIAIRKVYDGVTAAGGLDTIEVSKDMIQAAKNAHGRYSEHLASRREAMKTQLNEEKEKKKAEKEKRELEAEKMKVLAEARKRAAEIEEKISDLSKKCKK